MTQTAQPIVELRKVSKRFGRLEVLRDVNLLLAAGESLAITGPSGSGKSTLLNIIGALDCPTGGQVLLDGQDLTGLGDSRLAEIRRRRIGLVFQLHHLLPQCTALENVLVPAMAFGRRVDAPTRDRAEQLLRQVGLADRTRHRPGQLSGGERQRVALARALINRPELLLADEPTGSLDRADAEALADLLMELNRTEGVSLIVVTHSPDLARRMGRVCRLRDGLLLDDGTIG